MTKKHDRDIFGEPIDSPPALAARRPMPHPGTGWIWAWAYFVSSLIGATGLPVLAVIDAAINSSPGADGSPFVWVIILAVLFVVGGAGGFILVLWVHVLAIIVGRRRAPAMPVWHGEWRR